MPTDGPESAGDESIGVARIQLEAVFLMVSNDFEDETGGPHQEREKLSRSERELWGRSRGWSKHGCLRRGAWLGRSVEQINWETHQIIPVRLHDPSEQEMQRGLLDLVEATITSGGKDPVDEKPAEAIAPEQ